MKLLKKLTPFATASAIAASLFGLSATASAEGLSGNVGVVSKYILRGGTAAAESEGATVQGGFDYDTKVGVYVGYWGSGLGYGNASAATGFENDIYAGWKHDFGPVNLNVGAIFYYYQNVTDSNTTEAVASVGYGPVTFGMKYLTKDVVWGNQGDIYWTLAGEVGLPKDFTLSATIGYYTYKSTGKFDSVGGDKANLKHIDFVLSHPIGKTGADMTLTYVVGGKDRNDNDLPNGTVLGVSYGFDI